MMNSFRTMWTTILQQETEWNVLWNFLLPIKTFKFYQRYFQTCDHIILNGRLPLSIHLIRFTIWLKIVQYAFNYAIKFEHLTRIIMFDYFYLIGLASEYNLVMCIMLITAVTSTKYLFGHPIKTEFVQMPKLILKETENELENEFFINNFNLPTRTNFNPIDIVLKIRRTIRFLASLMVSLDLCCGMY